MSDQEAKAWARQVAADAEAAERQRAIMRYFNESDRVIQHNRSLRTRLGLRPKLTEPTKPDIFGSL